MDIRRRVILSKKSSGGDVDIDTTYSIMYTSSDGNVVTPYATNVFGANITSNTYVNGQGIITFDGSVTNIGDYAFYHCTSLTSVTIPDSVTSIGFNAFAGCESLTSITIPNSVTSVGNGIFASCYSLTRVYCKSITPPRGDYYMFANTPSNKILYVPRKSVDAYKSAQYWSDYADYIVGYDFEDDGESGGDVDIDTTYSIMYTSSDGNVVTPYKTDVFGANITSNTYVNGQGIITFDGPVTSIGYMAFSNCTSLTSVTIPNSVTKIVSYAFSQCSSLTSVTIPNGVTEIGSSAFQYCKSLTSVTIPDSVTSIGGTTFSNCTSLKTFYGKFASADNRCLIIDGVLTLVALAELTNYVIPNEVTSIGASAFYGCSSLTSITIPDSVTSIGNSAFYYCRSLTSITIPDSVTSIGSYAFGYCTSLTSVTIGNSVTSIGNEAFRDCTSLKTFYGKFASADNRCLIIDGVLKSFATNCGATEYTIPNSVTSIGDSAFDGCTSLTSVTIPDSVTKIGSSAFSDCTSLKSVTIPDSVTSIGMWAFQYCKSLTSVTIGGGVKTIGNYVFRYCSSLTSVYCKATTPPTGVYDAFDSNASGRTIYVPTASVDAYKASSGWSEYADYIVGYNF